MQSQAFSIPKSVPEVHIFLVKDLPDLLSSEYHPLDEAQNQFGS